MNKRIPTGSIKKKKPSRRHEVSGTYAGGALRGAALDEPVQTVVLGLRETELRERHAAPGHQPLEHHERSLVLVPANLPDALLGVIDVVHLDLRDFLTLRTHKYSRKSHLCQQQAV